MSPKETPAAGTGDEAGDDELETGMFIADPPAGRRSRRAAAVAKLKEILARENDPDWLPEIYGDQDDGLVLRLREVATKYKLTGPDVKVFYPGSAVHVGIARAFGRKNVIHVDPDEKAVKVLVQKGYSAEVGTKEEFNPGINFDLIISLNAGTLEQDLLDRLLKPTGLVVANNYHGSANRMNEYSEFELIEAFLPYYEDNNGKWVNANQAVSALGVKYVTAIGGGKVKVEKESHDPDALAVPLNPDALFVFRRKSEISSGTAQA